MEKKVILNTLAGILLGALSWYASYTSFSSYGNLIGLAPLILYFVAYHLLTGRKLNEILGEGGWYTIGFWFATWTLLKNVFV
jgi:hypothetical protein